MSFLIYINQFDITVAKFLITAIDINNQEPAKNNPIEHRIISKTILNKKNTYMFTKTKYIYIKIKLAKKTK